MIIDSVLIHYLCSYLVIGVSFALVSDLAIYYAKSSEQYTFLEIVFYTVFWPIVLLILLFSFFNKN
jgi:hypothetical protein